MVGFGLRAQSCWNSFFHPPSRRQMVSFGSRAQPCWICFISFSQPSLDGELRLARSAVLVFIYLVHSPSCPQMASSSSRTPTHLFFSYYYSSPPAVDRQRASARTHSRVGSFFYILRLCQLSIDGERLSFGSSHAQLHCFFFFYSSSTPAVYGWQASACVHSHVGFFFTHSSSSPAVESKDSELRHTRADVLIRFLFLSGSNISFYLAL